MNLRVDCMQLEYAFIAKLADAIEGAGFSAIGGGVTTLSGPELPIATPILHLVARFRFTAEECGKQHNVRFDLVDPAGAAVPAMSAVVPIQPQMRHEIPEKLTAAVAVLGLLTPSFQLAGEYVFHFSIGDQHLGSTSLHINPTGQTSQGTPPGTGEVGNGA